MEKEKNLTLVVCFFLLLKGEIKNAWHLQPLSSIWRPLAFLPVTLSLSPGDLSNPGIKPGFPALQIHSLPSEPWEKSNDLPGELLVLCIRAKPFPLISQFSLRKWVTDQGFCYENNPYMWYLNRNDTKELTYKSESLVYIGMNLWFSGGRMEGRDC